MYRFRFHLQRGKDYLKWQLKNVDAKTKCYLPVGVKIKLMNCVLVNNPSSANKIFTGESAKFVCAWIEFESYEFIKELPETKINIRFNPRVDIHWFSDTVANLDGSHYKELFVEDGKIFV